MPNSPEPDEAPGLPVVRVSPSDDVMVQQLVVGKDRRGQPYVLTVTAHRDTGEITARLGQTLDAERRIG